MEGRYGPPCGTIRRLLTRLRFPLATPLELESPVSVKLEASGCGHLPDHDDDNDGQLSHGGGDTLHCEPEKAEMVSYLLTTYPICI